MKTQKKISVERYLRIRDKVKIARDTLIIRI